MQVAQVITKENSLINTKENRSLPKIMITMLIMRDLMLHEI